MLFEYYGKHIVQPRRDLFEQATKMQVSFSANTGFLTRVEAAAALGYKYRRPKMISQRAGDSADLDIIRVLGRCTV